MKEKIFISVILIVGLLFWQCLVFAQDSCSEIIVAYDNLVSSRWYFVAYIDPQKNIKIYGNDPGYKPREINNKNAIKLAANYENCFYETQEHAIYVEGFENRMLAEYLPGVKQLVTTDETAFALMEDGTVRDLYGCNTQSYSEFDRWEDVVYLTTGRNFLVGLRGDGSVVVDGNTVLINKRKVKKWKNVKQIHAGASNIIALTYDNKILFENSYYDLTKKEYSKPKKKIDFSSWTDVVQVTAGHNFAAGLRSDGTVVLAGWEEYYVNEYGMDKALSWTDIVYIEAYQDCLLGVKSDGQIVAIIAPRSGYDILEEDKKYILLTK